MSVSDPSAPRGTNIAEVSIPSCVTMYEDDDKKKGK